MYKMLIRFIVTYSLERVMMLYKWSSSELDKSKRFHLKQMIISILILYLLKHFDTIFVKASSGRVLWWHALVPIGIRFQCHPPCEVLKLWQIPLIKFKTSNFKVNMFDPLE